MGVPFQGIRRQSHLLKQPDDTFLAFAIGSPAVDDQGLLDDPSHRCARVEGRVGILKDHLDLVPVVRQVPPLQVGYVNAIEHDATGIGFDQTQDRLAQRRLAATRFADQSDRFPRPDIEADAIDRIDGSPRRREMGLQVMYRQQGHYRPSPLPRRSRQPSAHPRSWYDPAALRGNVPSPLRNAGQRSTRAPYR